MNGIIKTQSTLLTLIIKAKDFDYYYSVVGGEYFQDSLFLSRLVVTISLFGATSYDIKLHKLNS